MITIKQVKRLDDTVHDVSIESKTDKEIDAKGKLLMLPALIDPHTSYQKDFAAQAARAIKGGVSSVFIDPGPMTFESYPQKKQEIDQQLAECGIPLRTHLYLEDTEEALEGLTRWKKKIIAVKTLMKSPHIDQVFQKTAQANMMLIVQLDSLDTLKAALEYAENYKTDLYLQGISSKSQLDFIKKTKSPNLLVSCEIDLPHFDHEELWEGIRDETIDCIGSSQDIETMLPKLMASVRAKKITMDKLVQLTHLNVENIFGLDRNSDVVLVDLELGKPVYTIVQGQVFEV